MCCQNHLLMIFVALLFLILVGFEIAMAVLALYTNSHAHRFIDHIWAVSAPEFRLYIEDTWDCCGLFNFTDRPAPPCPLGGSVRACYPSLKTDVNTLLIIVFCASIAVVISQIAFLVATSLLAYILHNKAHKTAEGVPLMSNASQ